MKKIARIAFVCLFISTVETASAQIKTDLFNPIRSAVTSQKIAPDARAGGMGDVGVATEADVASQFWNPAKYPFAISRPGFDLN